MVIQNVDPVSSVTGAPSAPTREMCIRWIKRMLAGTLRGKDDEDLKIILRRAPPGPHITLTVDVGASPNVGVQTHARGVTEAQIRPMLERAVRAVQAEIEALQDCPYHAVINSALGGSSPSAQTADQPLGSRQTLPTNSRGDG